jgi:hypothetical protein
VGLTINWQNESSVLRAFAAYPGIFDAEIRHALELCANLLVGAVREKTPSSDGTLASLIDYSPVQRTATGYQVDIGDPTEYGEAIEYGRKPGSRMPPVFALTNNFEQLDQWVWSHRQYFDDVEDETDAAQVAYLIARKIASRGFASAPDGPGKGWGMYAKAAAAGGAAEQQTIQVMEAARARIARLCEQAVA